MATIRDVAKLADVSVTTVSRVLNRRGYISEEMHDKVYRAMEQLHYQPNEIARSLTKRRTKIIGLLVPVMNHPFFSEVVSEFVCQAGKLGYKTMVYCSENDREVAAEYVSMLKANQVDGVMLCLRTRKIEALLDDGMPVVTFERLKVGSLPAVGCDNRQGGALAAQELLDCGCKRPVIVGTRQNDTLPGVERCAGFTDVMARAGISVPTIDYVEEEFLQGSYARIAEALFETVPDVDGAFCTNDLIASYVMQRAVQLGKRIPEDLKVIGFNDTYQASSTIPPLTSVRQPVPQMVERALSILMRQIRGEKVDLTTSLPVTLNRRGSTRGFALKGE